MTKTSMESNVLRDQFDALARAVVSSGEGMSAATVARKSPVNPMDAQAGGKPTGLHG